MRPPAAFFVPVLWLGQVTTFDRADFAHRFFSGTCDQQYSFPSGPVPNSPWTILPQAGQRGMKDSRGAGRPRIVTLMLEAER
jgi:hypothetical protein